MSPARDFLATAERLRRAFDRSFQVPPPPPAEPAEELLCLRVAQTPYAVRLDALGRISEAGPLTFLPSSAPHLVGLAGVHGEVVPVFDLASLLGHPRAEGPRWLLTPRGEPPLALAVAELAGRAHLPSHVSGEGASPDGMTLLDLPALVARIRRGRGEHP